jgi:hypothetical protein
VANGLVFDGWPLRPTVLNPGMNNPVGRGSLGPRLEAALDVASYPVPTSDGRGWKYCGSGLPAALLNAWPASVDPITLPSPGDERPVGLAAEGGLADTPDYRRVGTGNDDGVDAEPDQG